MVDQVELLPCPFVAGTPYFNLDGECWIAEVQIIGGHEVAAEVYSDNEEDVVLRQMAVLHALAAMTRTPTTPERSDG